MVAEYIFRRKAECSAEASLHTNTALRGDMLLSPVDRLELRNRAFLFNKRKEYCDSCTNTPRIIVDVTGETVR